METPIMVLNRGYVGIVENNMETFNSVQGRTSRR